MSKAITVVLSEAEVEKIITDFVLRDTETCILLSSDVEYDYDYGSDRRYFNGYTVRVSYA